MNKNVVLKSNGNIQELFVQFKKHMPNKAIIHLDTIMITLQICKNEARIQDYNHT